MLSRYPRPHSMLSRAHRGIEVEPLDDVHCMNVVQVNAVVQRTCQHLFAATQHLKVRRGWLGSRYGVHVGQAGHQESIRLVRNATS